MVVHQFLIFDKLIEEELGIPAFVANPFINMALSNKIKPQSLSNDDCLWVGIKEL